MNTIDLTHLAALNLRLSHERMRLAAAPTPFERTFREVQVAGIAREIVSEKAFLGISDVESDMTDDELLAELLG